MESRGSVRLVSGHSRKRNEEIICVLSAISIVSKRLARLLSDLEHNQEQTMNGGSMYEPGQSHPIR